MRHSNPAPSGSLDTNSNAASRDRTVPDGPAVIVVSGGEVSTVKTCGTLTPVLLAASDCSARAVNVPGLRAGESADHEPPEAAAVNSCSGATDVSEPLQMLMVTVGRSPAALPAPPDSSGVVSFVNEPSPGLVKLTVGAVVSGASTVNVRVALVPMLPAPSCCSARAVYWPLASAGVTSADHEPPDLATVSVRTGDPDVPVPAQTFTVTSLESPAAVPAAPDRTGVGSVVSAPSAGLVTVTTGAVVSTVKLRAALVPLLPASSACSATTVYAPVASVGAVVDQEPPDRVGVSVWSGAPEVFPAPLQIFTVTVPESPVLLPAAPASDGVVSFV